MQNKMKTIKGRKRSIQICQTMSCLFFMLQLTRLFPSPFTIACDNYRCVAGGGGVIEGEMSFISRSLCPTTTPGTNKPTADNKETINTTVMYKG